MRVRPGLGRVRQQPRRIRLVPGSRSRPDRLVKRKTGRAHGLAAAGVEGPLAGQRPRGSRPSRGKPVPIRARPQPPADVVSSGSGATCPPAREAAARARRPGLALGGHASAGEPLHPATSSRSRAHARLGDGDPAGHPPARICVSPAKTSLGSRRSKRPGIGLDPMRTAQSSRPSAIRRAVGPRVGATSGIGTVASAASTPRNPDGDHRPAVAKARNA